VVARRDRITLAVLELRENEDLAKLERTWWIDKGQCGSGSTFMKVRSYQRFFTVQSS